jgi:hypothetical protein
MKKKTLAIVIVFTILFSSIPVSEALAGNRKVDWLIEEDLISGYPDGSYGLDNSITRAEVSTLITRVLKSEDMSEMLKFVQSRFNDISLDHWANGYINFAASMGYVNGYPDNSFRPSNNITYSEVIKILVIINEDTPNAADFQGESWATPYIIKAIETGIMNGITIPNADYNSFATRENVFEMIYNAMMIKYLESTEDYKAIVIGNSRTSNIGENEISIQIIETGDQLGNFKYSYSAGDVASFKIDSPLDSEDLLGKVVRVSLDKEGVLIRILIDNSFDYYLGPFLAYEDSIMINTGESFDVYYNPGSSRYTDRLYQLYHNDGEYDYYDFLERFDEIDGIADGSYVSEFARITTKGNVVYFIDSYDFDDIAPVAYVEDNGRNISIYNDNLDSSIEKIYLKSVFGFFGDKFENIELKDILAEDVIHIYGNRAIVKMDAAYSGQYKGIEESSEVPYALINRQYFQVRGTDYKKPIYSLDGIKFATLDIDEAGNLLGILEGRRVVFLIDLNQSLQLISQYY